MAMLYAAFAPRSKYVVECHVVGIERRQRPGFGGMRSNHVFSITVQWSSSKRFQIYRQYSDFFTLQQRLSSLFPDIAGSLPQVPALYLQRMFGLLNESAHESHLSLIDNFCQVILKLPDEVSHSRCVSDFFSPQPGDDKLESLNPVQMPTEIAHRPRGAELPECKVKITFKGENEEQMSVTEGEYVVVIREDPSGWACVGRPDFKSKSGKIGWIPASFLQPVSALDESCIDHSVDYAHFSPPVTSTVKEQDKGDKDDYYNIYLEQYLAVSSYNAEDDGQLKFSSGTKMCVIDKEADGWWFATCGEKQGWVPSTFLVRLEAGPEPQDSLASPESFVVTEDHEEDLEDEISVPEGAIVKVTVKKLSGWWQVRYQGRTGLVPASKLRPSDPNNPANSMYINVRREKTFKAPPRRSTKTTSHQLTGSLMSNRPPASLPHGKPSLKTVSEQKDFSLSGSYEEPRQWVVPMYQQFPVDSSKAPTSLNSSDESKWEIPAVPCSSPPSAADYAVVSSKEKGGSATAPASRLTLSLGPASGAGSSEVTEKRRSQTLVVGKGKASASLGISVAQGKADTRSKEVQHNGGSSQNGVVMAETTGSGDSHSQSADSSPTTTKKSVTRSLPDGAIVRARPTLSPRATTSLSAVRDSFIDVSEMPDNDKPRYTKKDLWKVLEEKNELKLKVYELEEELEQLKSVLRGRLVDEHEPPARTPTAENAEIPNAAASSKSTATN